jgi:hypothetical protein
MSENVIGILVLLLIALWDRSGVRVGLLPEAVTESPTTARCHDLLICAPTLAPLPRVGVPHSPPARFAGSPCPAC